MQGKKIQQQISTQAKKGEHKEPNTNKYNWEEQLKQHKSSNNKCKISKEQTTTNCWNFWTSKHWFHLAYRNLAKEHGQGQSMVNTSDLNNNNLRLDTVNRTKRQGGRIARLHKKEYNTMKIETNLQLYTLEHGVWSTTIRNKKLTLAGIYHPPIGSLKGNTHTKFLDEVSKLAQLLITNYTNVILLGDFNIHAQDTENPNSIIYNDTMEALGLKQHIGKPTHRLGNTLDLIYTEILDRVRVIHSFIGNIISDHRIVGIEVKIKNN